MKGVIVHRNEKSDNGDDDNDKKIYASMEWMSGNNKISNIYLGDSSQLTNWILDSGETCHMTPHVSNFIPGSLEETDKILKLRMEIMSRRGKKEKLE